MTASRNNVSNPVGFNNGSKSHSNEEPRGIREHVAHGLDAVAEAMTTAHFAGAHMKGPLKYVGPLAATAAEIIRNPAGEVTEKLVCGTTVAFTKEAVNTVVAEKITTAAGLAATFVATPAGGVVTAGAVAVFSYKIVNKITEPLGKLAEHQCHRAFNYMRASHQTSQPIDIPPPTTGSTASILSAMHTSQASIYHDAKNDYSHNPVINRCGENIQNLENSLRDYRAGIASDLTSPILSSLSAEQRPEITFTSMMDRQVSKINEWCMFSTFKEAPPPPSTSPVFNGFYNSGGEGGLRTYCDSYGNCYTVSGGGGKDCRSGSRCKKT